MKLRRASLREGEWEKRSVVVAVVVVSLCRGRRPGLRRLVRRVSAKSLETILGSGAHARRRREKAVSGRRGRSRLSLSWSSS